MSSQESTSGTLVRKSKFVTALYRCHNSALNSLNSEFWKRLLATFVAVSGLLFLDGQLGPFTLYIRRVAALACILVVAAVVRRRATSFIRTDSLKLQACCLAALGIFMLPTTQAALLLYICVLASLASIGKSEAVVPGVVEASFCYFVLGMVKDFLPQVRIVEQSILQTTSRYVSGATGIRFNGSGVAISLPAVCVVILLCIWRWRLFRRSGPLWYLFLLTAAWFFLLPRWIPAPGEGSQELFARSAIVSLTIVGLGILPACTIRSVTVAAPEINQRARKTLLTIVLASVLFAGVVSSGGPLVLEPPNRSILVHNRGGLDWKRPVFGKFGSFSSGMFGLLPVYARENGFEFDVLDKDSIEGSDLSNTQVLVLINSPKQWSSAEKAVISEFVSDGGSLLVLGDHTDVFGLMKGFNPLIEDFGIRFKFDSAYYSESGWRGCCAISPHTVTSKWDLKGHGVAIGASLDLLREARPLLVGRYAHSDDGVANNKIGSFLGNYSLDEGEKIGNLPLVCLLYTSPSPRD